MTWFIRLLLLFISTVIPQREHQSSGKMQDCDREVPSQQYFCILRILFLFVFHCRSIKGWKQSLTYGNIFFKWTASSEFGTYRLCEQRRFRRACASARSYKQWIKRNLQRESQIPSPSEWLGMRSWNLSWRNARRHKFAWRGPNYVFLNLLLFFKRSIFYVRSITHVATVLWRRFVME